MQLFSSLQFFSLSLSMALVDAVSGIILISAFLPLDSLALSWLALPSLVRFNLVLIMFPFSFISMILLSIRFRVMFFFSSITSSRSWILSRRFSIFSSFSFRIS